MKKELRYFDCEVRVETREDGGKMVRGHAALFGSLSENLGGFREMIEEGAFDNVLSDDVRALFNHDSNLILGRTVAKTLRLKVDKKGLVYEYDSPNTTYANDLLVSLERGDVNQSSFGFQVDKDKWEEDKDGRIIRRILSVRRLYDVSPVTYPAYPDTDVAKRGLDQYNKEKEGGEVPASYWRSLEQKLKLKEQQIKL